MHHKPLHKPSLRKPALQSPGCWCCCRSLKKPPGDWTLYHGDDADSFEAEGFTVTERDRAGLGKGPLRLYFRVGVGGCAQPDTAHAAVPRACSALAHLTLPFGGVCAGPRGPAAHCGCARKLCSPFPPQSLLLHQQTPHRRHSAAAADPCRLPLHAVRSFPCGLPCATGYQPSAPSEGTMATAPTSVGELIMLPPEMLEEVMKACEMRDLLQLEVTCRLFLNASRQSEQLWAYVLTLRQPVEAHALLQFARSREFCRAFSYRRGRSPWVTDGSEDIIAFSEPELAQQHAVPFDYQILMTVGHYSGLMEWVPKKGHVEHGTDDLDLQLRLPATAEFEGIIDKEDFKLMTSAHILNLSEDHLDRHGDMAGYRAAKLGIFRGARHAVVNAEDSMTWPDDERLPVDRFTTQPPDGQQWGIAVHDDGGGKAPWLMHGTRPLMAVDELRLPGRHNQANALAALAMGTRLGFSLEAMRRVLARFAGLPHRGQLVGEADGVRWVNDSKGTNLGALMASLEGMSAPVILLAGGQAKDADFAPLGPLAGARARAVIVFGQDGERIAAAVDGLAGDAGR